MHSTPALGYCRLQKSLLGSSAHAEAGGISRFCEDIVAAIGRQIASGIQAAYPCEAHKGRGQQSGHSGWELWGAERRSRDGRAAHHVALGGAVIKHGLGLGRTVAALGPGMLRRTLQQQASCVSR